MNEPEAITVERKEWDRLRAIAARVENVKGMAKVIHKMLSANSSTRPIEIATVVANFIEGGSDGTDNAKR